MAIIVTYKNQGRPEKATYNTEEEAREGAEFLKFQGATHVRVRNTARKEHKNTKEVRHEVG